MLLHLQSFGGRKVRIDLAGESQGGMCDNFTLNMLADVIETLVLIRMLLTVLGVK